MKKAFLIIGICITVIGLGLSVASLAMVDFNFEKLNTEKYTEKTYSTSAVDVNKIVVSEINRRVEVKKSADNNIHIYYFESDKEHYNISLVNKELSISTENNMEWYDYIKPTFNFYNLSLRLEIPENILENINIETKNGDIIAEDISVSQNISLKTNNGRIYSKDISCQTFDCNSYNGRIEIDEIIANSLKSDIKNGAFILEEAELQKLEAIAYNGAIEFEAVDVYDATLKNHNGRIRGSFIGSLNEFQIKSGTKNGSCNLPEYKQNGDKSLVAETYNGSVNITFTSDKN